MGTWTAIIAGLHPTDAYAKDDRAITSWLVALRTYHPYSLLSLPHSSLPTGVGKGPGARVRPGPKKFLGQPVSSHTHFGSKGDELTQRGTIASQALSTNRFKDAEPAFSQKTQKPGGNPYGIDTV